VHTKSKIIAVAIGAAFALPTTVYSQTNVVVYGKMYPNLTHVNLSGATPTGAPVSTLTSAPVSTNNISLNSQDAPNSRLGFRGTEDLGSGLKAIFQLEIGFNLDTGQASDSTAPFSRNTFVGLEGGFGTVRLGNMDTVFKEYGDQMSFLGITSGNYFAASNILAKGIGTNSASSFHLRRTNSLWYETPQIAGFTAGLDWSPNETAGDASSGVISSGIKYENGPVYASVQYEVHKDMFGASLNIPAALRNSAATGQSSRDTAVRGTLQYSFPGDLKFEVDVQQSKYTESGGLAGHFSEYKHNSWNLSMLKASGPWTFMSTYGKSQAGNCSLVGGATCSTGGLNAMMTSVGAGYSLSKRTALFAVYSYLKNDASSVQSNWLNGKPVPGQDISTVGVGILHSF
jgi:predicted porin